MTKEMMTAKTMNGIEVKLPVYEPISGATVLEDGWKELLAASVKLAVEAREGEELRFSDGLDIVVELRRPNAWNFEVRVENDGDRFCSDNLRRLENGDVAKPVKLVVRSNWSALGTVDIEKALDFAKRLTEVAAQVERGLRVWARGQEFVRVYETAAKELERAEDWAVCGMVRDAWEGQIPESKRNLNSPRKMTIPALAVFAGRTFEVWMPKDAKGRTLKASVTVQAGGVCVAVKA